MANPTILPQLPPIDPNNGPEAIYNLAWWVQRFIGAFPYAVGQAIDPTSTGQAASGDSSRSGSLTIDAAPTGISYATATLGNDGSGTIQGYIDVTFTLPARAVGVNVYYKENGTSNNQVLFFPASPGRILGLKVGVSYDTYLKGVAANGDEGPASGTTTTAVSVNMASAPTAPSGQAATGYPGAIIVSWTAHTDPTVKQYAIQRADDAGFTTNVVTYYSRTNFFVDQFAGQGVTRYYKVAALRDTGQVSSYSGSVSATTAGVNTAELVDESVNTVGIDTNAGPATAGSGTEVDTVDVTISTDGGLVLVFATTTSSISGGEEFLVTIYKGDSSTGTPIGYSSVTGGASTDVTTTAIALDASPASSQEYTATFTPTSGGMRDAVDNVIIAMNVKK